MGAEEKGVGDARGNGEFQGGNKVMCRNCEYVILLSWHGYYGQGTCQSHC